MKTPDFVKEEITQVVNAILAIVGMLMSFGLIALTPEQLEATGKALPFIVAGFSAAIYLANRFITRPNVTPMSNPKTNDGTPLVPMQNIGHENVD